MQKTRTFVFDEGNDCTLCLVKRLTGICVLYINGSDLYPQNTFLTILILLRSIMSIESHSLDSLVSYMLCRLFRVNEATRIGREKCKWLCKNIRTFSLESYSIRKDRQEGLKEYHVKSSLSTAVSNSLLFRLVYEMSLELLSWIFLSLLWRSFKFCCWKRERKDSKSKR